MAIKVDTNNGKILTKKWWSIYFIVKAPADAANIGFKNQLIISIGIDVYFSTFERCRIVTIDDEIIRPAIKPIMPL